MDLCDSLLTDGTIIALHILV